MLTRRKAETTQSLLGATFIISYMIKSIRVTLWVAFCHIITLRLSDFVLYCLSSSGQYLHVPKKCWYGQPACLQKMQCLFVRLDPLPVYFLDLSNGLSLRDARRALASAAE